MSRIAKMGVTVPEGVTVQLADEGITVKGKGGELNVPAHHLVKVADNDGQLSFEPTDGSRKAVAMSGTMRQLVNNMVVGVSTGFEKKLVLKGVGFRAQAQGRTLNLSVGFSHPVNIDLPEGITAETPVPTEIVLKGADRQGVGQLAAVIRGIRPPEPYKGKGIRYADEHVRIKETKKK